MRRKLGFAGSAQPTVLNLEPDTRAETDRLFRAPSINGKVGMALQDMFWGAYFGSLTDQFGVQWMFNCTGKDGRA
jgi:PhnB protein